jgi:hemolysin-activating ACP:hemolysin acyltransferase
MSWQGSISDLMCLAHEVAHAVQLQLSAGSFMPPVARETCAFLGELALIDWARRNQTDLATKLLQVWREENQRYFGDDCALLRAALVDPESAYTYRMNYPLARAAAVVMWRAGADLQRLFKAGSEAINLLPLARIADVAGLSQNYLPPLPLPYTDQPAVDAYRALGAMALLDIDFWKGESERRIEDYYANLLHHLQNRTAFVALDEARRPVGYSTWRKATGGNTVTLTRQAAPFGDHLLLQKSLERHLGQNTDVKAQHPRSARQEQVAW